MNLSDINLFDDNLEQLIMNSRIEVEKFDPKPTFENTINEIKYNHLKIIAFSAKNSSVITSFDENSNSLCINNKF